MSIKNDIKDTFTSQLCIQSWTKGLGFDPLPPVSNWSVDINFYIPDAYSRIMPSHSPIADIDFCLFNWRNVGLVIIREDLANYFWPGL